MSDTGVTYLFLFCGEQEGLLPPNRRFAAALAEHHVQHEFHVGAGGHDWNQWNAQLAGVFASLHDRLGRI